MKPTRLLLPLVSLCGAALLLAPARGFATLGTELSLSQRDFRVFNNFTDASANNNVTPDTQFPGALGAVMAIWKGCIEWGSELHGTGGGDPWQPGGLGSGGANFDPALAGQTDSVGGTNDNIHSELSATDFGVYAFAEGPADDGWRIRYYQNWVWSDGPTIAISSQIDIQGIACHEYGHALGLDHSVSPATMKPATVNGNENRDIESDDKAGIQSIYGVKSGSKPHVSSATLVGTTVTINGTGFAPTGNEVWFTNQLVTAASLADPLIKATGVASTGGGTLITMTIPDLAGKGDILVKGAGSGHSSLSNAFPFNGQGVGPIGPGISSVVPGTVSAVNVGSAQIVTISGTHFTPDISVSVDGTPVFGIPSPYTIVNENTITLDPPLVSSLGAKTVTISNSFGTALGILNYAANDPPALQAGDGNEPVSFIGSINLTIGGTPGALFFLGASLFKIPSVLPGVVDLEIGNNFTNIFQIGGAILIPASGHTTINLPGTGIPPLTTFFLEGVTFEPVPALPLPDSNSQELFFLF